MFDIAKIKKYSLFNEKVGGYLNLQRLFNWLNIHQLIPNLLFLTKRQKMRTIPLTLFFTCLVLTSALSLAQPDTQKQVDSSEQDTVVQFDIKQKIGPSALRKTKKAFDLVRKHDADRLLLHLNTYGGRVTEADSIRNRLLNSPVPVYVFINPNAASAGALISIACTKIYMTEQATMGAATVVNQKGKKMPEKYQSYMRGTMRATAQARGRDPDIAEAMVDESIELDTIAPKGELLTFTRKEAIANDYCHGKAKSLNQVLEKEGLQNAAIVRPEKTFVESIITWLINPAVSSVLIMLILGGLYFELQSPGLGLPIAASIIAALLYFAPLYLEGLAANWEIAIFILGIILIAVEIFVIPGLGVSGITGFLLLLVSFVFTMINNDFFDFTFTRGDDVLTALISVLASIVGGIILVLISGKPFLRSRFFQRLVLQETLAPDQDQTNNADSNNVEAQYQSEVESQSKVGATGSAYTELSPSGKILIDEEMFDGVSEGEFIEKGKPVKVIKESSNRLVVRVKE